MTNQTQSPSPRDLGAFMPVKTHSDMWEFYCVGMGDSPRQTTDERKMPKIFPATGGYTYATGAIARLVSKDGTIRNDKTASVKVMKPASVYELGEVYAARGVIFVQPYESNGRVALSITVEELVPVASTPAGNRSAKPAENAA